MKQEREVQLSDQNVRILYATQPMVQMQVADTNGRRITVSFKLVIQFCKKKYFFPALGLEYTASES